MKAGQIDATISPCSSKESSPETVEPRRLPIGQNPNTKKQLGFFKAVGLENTEPDLASAEDAIGDEYYLDFIDEVCKKFVVGI